MLEFELGELKEGTAHPERLQEVAERMPLPGMTAEHVWLSVLIPLVNRIANVEDRVGEVVAVADRLLSLPALSPGMALVHGRDWR